MRGTSSPVSRPCRGCRRRREQSAGSEELIVRVRKRSRAGVAAALLTVTFLVPAPGLGAPQSEARPGQWSATVYAARMSGERTWQHMVQSPFGSDYVDVYLLVGALARDYGSRFDGALRLEAEGQLARYFGDQDHWEINAAPVVARWQRFPWSKSVATSFAFGLGLSYASELPPVEVELEGTSERLLVYWMAEITAGPPHGRWAVSLRLHHRSDAWGLLGEDGGMNALGLGFRYRWGAARNRPVRSLGPAGEKPSVATSAAVKGRESYAQVMDSQPRRPAPLHLPHEGAGVVRPPGEAMADYCCGVVVPPVSP